MGQPYFLLLLLGKKWHFFGGLLRCSLLEGCLRVIHLLNVYCIINLLKNLEKEVDFVTSQVRKCVFWVGDGNMFYKKTAS
jgi:hypothetical protein